MPPIVQVAQKLFIPLGQIAFFSLIGSYGGSQPLAFYLIGNAVLIASGPITWVSLAIIEERWMGTLQLLLATPANRVALFYGRCTVQVVEAVAMALMAFVWAMVIFGLSLSIASLLQIMVVVLVAAIACAGAGLLLGALAYIWLDQSIASNSVIFALLLLSGANIPRNELPGWLQAIGDVLPLTRSIEASRLIAAGDSLIDVLPTLGAELLVGAVYAALGFVLFRWLEVQARRKGTLEGV
jgi:ABC-2 type transport system permease protein